MNSFGFEREETKEEREYRKALGEHEGRWVGVVNEYEIIASEEELGDLFDRLEELGEDEAVVFKVNSLPSFYSMSLFPV